MPTSKKDFGRHLFGSLHSTDASGVILIPMWDNDGDQFHLSLLNHLNIQDASIIAVASGDTYMFWDQGDIELVITTATTATDVVTIAGDLTNRFSVGDTIYIYGSTGNDGEDTITSISYDPGTNLTTIGVAVLADGTDDGKVAGTYYEIATADAGSNFFTITGDYRREFKIGRLFVVDGSTGNDAGGADYTVTNVSYSSTTGATTITVASVVNGTDDGYIIPQATMFAGGTLLRGTYTANSGHSKRYNRFVVTGQPGAALYGQAASGAVDFEFHALLQTNLAKTGPNPAGYHVE